MNSFRNQSVRAGSFRAWQMAIRPKTLPVGAAPILVGWAVAISQSSVQHNAIVGVVCMITALLLQILSNLANDYYDFKKGADTDNRKGPKRVMQSGLLSSSQMKRALVIVASAAAVAGSFLVYHGGAVYLALGGLALVSAVAYTGGPYPLGYNGLGDLFVFLFFGPAAVIGTAHLCLGEVPPYTLPAAFAMGLLAVNLLVVNNVRDEIEDRIHNKKTPVARWGKAFGVAQYISGLALSYLCVAVIASLTHNFTVWSTLVLLPFGLYNIRQLHIQTGAPLNRVLAHTALFTLIFGVILSAALITGS